MISRLLGNITRELRHLDLRCQILFECSEQNLSQTNLETIHQIGNASVAVVLGEVDELSIDKLLVRDVGLCSIKVCITVIELQPVLSVVSALFIEYHVNGVVTLIGMLKPHNLLLFKVFAEFLASACTQSFVILDFPTMNIVFLFPTVELTVIVKVQFNLALFCFQYWCIHKSNKAGNTRQSGPLRLEQVNAEALDMTAVQILIGHEEDFAIAKAFIDIFNRVVFFARFQAQYLFYFGDFFVFGDLLCGLAAHIENLALHRINANNVAVVRRKP